MGALNTSATCANCTHCTTTLTSSHYKNFCNYYNVDLPSLGLEMLCKKFIKINNYRDDGESEMVLSMLTLDDVLYEWNMYALALGQNPVPVMNLQYARDVSTELGE